MMKAAVLHKVGNPPTTPDILSVEEIEIPEPKKGEVLVKVAAASINPVDWKIMAGLFPGDTSGSVGCDVSGTVESIGPDTDTSLKVGDEIYADARRTPGTFAEYAIVQAIAAAPKPKNLDMIEAASLPLVGLNVVQSLTRRFHFKEGHKICVLGGSGGVGSVAVQVAKAWGASEVWSTGSSVDKIKGLGADIVVNYKEKSIVEELKGKDFDMVYDTIGGEENWIAAQGALKKGGRFVTIVGDGVGPGSMIARVLYRKAMSLFGGPAYDIFMTDTTAPAISEDMKKLTELVESGKVKPVLDGRSFELTTESMHKMIEASMSNRVKGKLILKVSS